MVAKERIGKEDGGLARHSVECTKGIDWENTRVLKSEHRVEQRKVIEGIESLSVRNRKKEVLNSFESLITSLTWRPLLNTYFIKENKHTRTHAQFNLN